MASHSEPVCITCGLPVGAPVRFNRLPNGQTCPSCRDRVLDSVPPALPSFRMEPIGRTTETETFDESFDEPRRVWPPKPEA
jgi:hypothetical protein